MIQETATEETATFWQAQYRGRYTQKWTVTAMPFDTEEKALAWYEREIAQPNRIPTELRIVKVTTVRTIAEIARGELPRE
jgi:hypothetical protein